MTPLMHQVEDEPEDVCVAAGDAPGGNPGQDIEVSEEGMRGGAGGEEGMRGGAGGAG